MQADLEAYPEFHNTRRPPRGRDMNGRTPAQVFTLWRGPCVR